MKRVFESAGGKLVAAVEAIESGQGREYRLRIGRRREDGSTTDTFSVADLHDLAHFMTTVYVSVEAWDDALTWGDVGTPAREVIDAPDGGRG